MIKLNLGCGNKYLKGFVNTDINKSVKADKYFNLNTFPYPFPDNHADLILMDNVMEHLNDISRVMKELHRISKQKGIVEIYVPYYKSDGAFDDPTHAHYFTEKSFDYFTKNNFEYAYYTKERFKLLKSELLCVNKTKLSKLRNLIPFKKVLKIFLFNMYDGIFFKLQVIK